MPQPAEVEGAHGQLLAEYQAAHGRLQTAVAESRGTEAQRLDQSLGALGEIFEQLDVDTRGFVSETIPSIYQAGAASTGVFTSFDQTSLAAVQALANQNYNDLLSTNQIVEGTTKRTLRNLARAGALDVMVGGKPAARAGRDLANLIQDVHGKVMTVTYANGAVHSLADWADTALRTQTAMAYNAGAIEQYREHGIGWVELSDGADCGLTSHDDPELANGLVVPLSVAEQYPLAHPRCGRSILPRPDITSAEEADRVNSQRDPDRLQREAERARERAERSTLTGQRFRVDTETARVAGRARRARQPRAASPTRSADGTRAPRPTRGQGPPGWSPNAPSRPGSARDVERLPRISELLENPTDTHFSALAGYMAGSYRSGFDVELRELRKLPSGGVKLGGAVLRNQNEAGQFERIITVQSGGALVVENAGLYVSPAAQGKGFAPAFNARMERWYVENGVAKVTVHAGLDRGGYAWAIGGFDWDLTVSSVRLRESLDTARHVAEFLRDEMTRRGELTPAVAAVLDRASTLPITDPRFPKPRQLAAIGRRGPNDSNAPAKAAFYDRQWFGVKVFSP